MQTDCRSLRLTSLFFPDYLTTLFSIIAMERVGLRAQSSRALEGEELLRDQFDESVSMGRANVEAIELVRRHCRHARVQLVHGNSMVGEALGLPMGLLEVRCEHAPPATSYGHVALQLVVEFYRSNCVGCAHREASGEMPNLATVVAEMDEEESKRRQIEDREAAERSRRQAERRQRRRLAVASQGYVVRELADWLDRLDTSAPRSSQLSGEEEQARRQIIDAAKHAPQLFGPRLVDTLLEMAADTAEAAALVAISELVRTQRCPARSAVEAAIAALVIRSEPEAAKLLWQFSDEFHPDDLPGLLDRLVEMASSQQEPWGSEPVGDGVLAAAAVDLPTLTTRIIDLLDNDDASTRGAAADAAALLLSQDAARVIALGPALVASIRGEDSGYAGDPHPATSALKALAEAWRNDPEQTMRIVEARSTGLPNEIKALLLRVVRFIQRFREPWDASDSAGRIAVEFCLRHLGGDWGDEAADEASIELESLAREVPHLLAPRSAALIGCILNMTAPSQASALQADQPLDAFDPSTTIQLAAAKIKRGARLRRAAEILGRIAREDPGSVLGEILPFLKPASGNEEQGRQVSLAVLDAFEEAASSDLLRDLLPITYTALLSGDALIRSKGIDLWAACARVAQGRLPEEFAVLAPRILADSYVVVHKRMLVRLRELRLPDYVIADLVGPVAAWAGTYVDDADVLNNAVWSLKYLAGRLADEEAAIAWQSVALSFAPKLNPYDRQRFLTTSWPQVLLESNVWARAAIVTLASPELIDYYNKRYDPLLTIFMERPQLLSSVSLDEIMPVSDVHRTQFMWRALEPIELLQAAGRWSDAARIAERVEARQPSGLEGQHARQLAGLIAYSTSYAELAADASASETNKAASLAAIREAADALRSGESTLDAGGSVALLLDTVVAQVMAGEVLCVRSISDPEKVAGQLEGAASKLQDAAGNSFASATQRHLLASAWRIAAVLMRYDEAVRNADPDANRFLAAAKRQAEVLSERARVENQIPLPSALTEFLTLAIVVQSPKDAAPAFNALSAAMAPLRLIGQLVPGPPIFRAAHASEVGLSENHEPPLAVCVADLRGAPITDIFVVRPSEVYTLGMTVWLSNWPEWAEACIVEPMSIISREALSLPKYVFSPDEAQPAPGGILLEGKRPLYCKVEQPVADPAIDCPLLVRFLGNGKEQSAEVAGYRRLRLRPFDPSKDALTEHEQTDQRLLAMYDRLTSPDYDTEDVRAFCRLFSSCVRAAQAIVFDKMFRKGVRVTEAMFHDELERVLRADPELEGRLTRRDAVAGGFDDLLHDDVIAELKVVRDRPVRIEDCARYLGQPTQYGVGRGSQLSILVVLDHSRKDAPPGDLKNYIGWLQPRLHGLEDSRYPSLVGVLIINTNLPVPSTWSGQRLEVVQDEENANRR